MEAGDPDPDSGLGSAEVGVEEESVPDDPEEEEESDLEGGGEEESAPSEAIDSAPERSSPSSARIAMGVPTWMDLEPSLD